VWVQFHLPALKIMNPNNFTDKDIDKIDVAELHRDIYRYNPHGTIGYDNYMCYLHRECPAVFNKLRKHLYSQGRTLRDTSVDVAYKPYFNPYESCIKKPKKK